MGTEIEGAVMTDRTTSFRIIYLERDSSQAATVQQMDVMRDGRSLGSGTLRGDLTFLHKPHKVNIEE